MRDFSGTSETEDLFKELVIVEEKIDGSQISFGKIDGELYARSKGATLNLAAPDKYFCGVCWSKIRENNGTD